MDDTFVIQKAEQNNQYLQHITSVDSHNQCPQETALHQDSIPILGTMVSPGPDNSLLTTVYRNGTHTDQYLHGTATIICQLSIVCLTPPHIGLGQFVLPTPRCS